MRQAQHIISQHTTQPRAQRPAVRYRKIGYGCRSRHRAKQPENDAESGLAQGAAHQQLPAPHSHRHQNHSTAQPQQLHQNIGNKGTGTAKHIMHRPVDRVIEARVLRRPCDQRRIATGHTHQQSQPQHFRSTATQKIPYGLRYPVYGKCGGCAHQSNSKTPEP